MTASPRKERREENVPNERLFYDKRKRFLGPDCAKITGEINTSNEDCGVFVPALET